MPADQSNANGLSTHTVHNPLRAQEAGFVVEEGGALAVLLGPARRCGWNLGMSGLGGPEAIREQAGPLPEAPDGPVDGRWPTAASAGVRASQC